MKVCSIAGCSRKHSALGWCRSHYIRAKKYGNPTGGKPIVTADNRITVCTVDGCSKKHYGNGFCCAHNAKFHKYGDPLGSAPKPPAECSVDGCDKKRVARGFCGAHWRRWRQHGDPNIGGPIRPAGRPKTGQCSVAGCNSPDLHAQLCQFHYGRRSRYGNPTATPPSRRRPIADRFFEKVDTTDSDQCWPWKGKTDIHGYGIIAVPLDKPRWTAARAHRVSYQLFIGSIPNGMQVDHICRRRNCVNPKHLRLATHKQNAENRSSSASSRTRSGIRGVRFNARSGKWEAHVTHNYRGKTVGGFDTPSQAAEVAKAIRRQLFTHNDEDWFGIHGQLELPIQPGTGVQVQSRKRVSK